MKNKIKISNTIKSFNKILEIEGDKSLSIRWALLASQANGKSKSKNLLKSEDVLSTLNCLKKLGVKIKFFKDICEITGMGLNGYRYKKDITLNAGNSGTLGRLILGLLVHSNNKIKLIGDKSLSKRDFLRITKPLEKFGAKFKTNSGKLPIIIKGTKFPNPITYNEIKGSAQCKSAVMLAALNTKGQTIIKAKKSRDHSELLFKYLKLPIKVTKKNNFDLIKIKGGKEIKPLNYKIPSDISSSAFFIILTILSQNSKLQIKNVNINPSRIGVIKILKIMGVKVLFKNIKIHKGEKIADIYVKSTNLLKAINCPTKFNSAAIDEFLLIFLVAAKAKGVSIFKNLSELNQKESPRLLWGSKILSKMGVKNIVTKDSIKIFGNPNLKINKKIIIKGFLKDHRIFMVSSIAALCFGGNWHIHDKNSVQTSFPSFLKKIGILGAKIQQ
ncbi:3-phosphoshikimate 1-carboxyvinyltransferase [Candidatus Pelagibacter sp.]|jgi:3-phosphoshikimate 1-carboxyvinyltransferase|nr:3-phosphoshikimate 1-carboxyvinyltransferase [Candidatus Pelagibacter sp.]